MFFQHYAQRLRKVDNLYFILSSDATRYMQLQRMVNQFSKTKYLSQLILQTFFLKNSMNAKGVVDDFPVRHLTRQIETFSCLTM